MSWNLFMKLELSSKVVAALKRKKSKELKKYLLARLIESESLLESGEWGVGS